MANPSWSKEDILTLARTIYGEARGEPPAGREAVAHVVMNRVRAKGFPDDVSQVCLQPMQFSCWTQNDPNRRIIESILPGANKVFDECCRTAEQVTSGEIPDNTGGATHYVAKFIPSPAWSKPPARMTVEIGVNKFYTNVG